MENAVEAKEQAHVQEMIDLERKLLTDKGNLQKVNETRCGILSSVVRLRAVDF